MAPLFNTKYYKYQNHESITMNVPHSVYFVQGVTSLVNQQLHCAVHTSLG